MAHNLLAQTVDPTNAVESIASSGVLGALVIVLLFTSGYLLRLLLKEKDQRLQDNNEMLVKQFEIQQATREVLDKLVVELRSKK